jgi:cellulose synthase (UDP-forming)
MPAPGSHSAAPPLSPALAWGLRLGAGSLLVVVAVFDAELVFIAVMAVVCAVLWQTAGAQRRARILAGRLLITMAALATIDYVQHRLVAVDMDGWWLAVPLLLVEIHAIFQSVGFNLTQWWPRDDLSGREAVIAAGSGHPPPPILILVPTVNEGRSVLGPTLRGAIAARARLLERWPDAQVTIAVANDGYVAGYADWRDNEALARELGVLCHTRTLGGGAKAGNIEATRHALMPAETPYLLAVFDADQVPEPDFLVRLVPYFADPQLGWVQTGQYYRNLDNIMARWAEQQMRLFYDVILPPKSRMNAVFLCGTNFLLRSQAIDGIGGFPLSSVTEDFAASIHMHAQGWNSLYHAERLSSGIGPSDFGGFVGQQNRWAVGTLGVTFRNLGLLVLGRSRKGRLTLRQRVQYLLSGTYYLCGVRDVVFVLAPLLFLVAGVETVSADAGLWVTFIVYWALNLLTMSGFANGRFIVGYTLLEFACVHTFVAAFFSALTGRKVRFTVTPKARTGRRDLSRMRYQAVLAVVIVAACAVGLATGAFFTAVLVNVAWMVYRLLIVLGILGIAWVSDQQRARALRVEAVPGARLAEPVA